VIGPLAVAVAVLVFSGVLAAFTVGQPPSQPGTSDERRLGAALALSRLDVEPATTETTATTAVLPPRTTSSTIATPPTTATTRPPITRTTTTTPSTTTSTAVLPTAAPPTNQAGPVTTANGARTSWSADQGGISLRMRIDPAAPVVGQPVRFLVSISAPDSCCATALNFGDGGPYEKVSPGTCTTPSNVTDAVVTHTYAGPGLYPVMFLAATFPCTLTVVDGQPVAPAITGATIYACILVGPTTMAYREPCA
jgi:hypothetical protein